MVITGSFETHITLDVPDLDQVREYASSRHWKLTHIVLGQGRHPSQPMLTSRSSGSLSVVLRDTQAFIESLGFLGIQALRIKVETCVENAVVPEDDQRAAFLPHTWHFEHHVKLLLSDGLDCGLIGEIGARHSARLSRNALREAKPDHHERFLTQRFYRTGRRSAENSLAALLEDLGRHQIEVLESEAEYVVFDSNVDLDAGWMKMPTHL